MTDKEKIRKEVERMHDLLPIMDGDNISINYADRICRTLEMYIDSLQEEPVSRTPADIEAAMQEVEEKSKAFTEAHQGENTDTILAHLRDEEPVSENLEQTSADYARERLSYDDYPTYNDEYELMLAFEAGANWQKEQLMKDAIDMIIGYWMPNGLRLDVDETENPYNIDEGNKVKLIIIKDE